MAADSQEDEELEETVATLNVQLRHKQQEERWASRAGSSLTGTRNSGIRPGSVLTPATAHGGKTSRPRGFGSSCH